MKIECMYEKFYRDRTSRWDEFAKTTEIMKWNKWNQQMCLGLKAVMTCIGMKKAAGTAVSGTGASTVRTPSTESLATIVAAPTSAGSLETTDLFTVKLRIKWIFSAHLWGISHQCHLYFRLKHLLMNPCWSGFSSCFPGGWIMVCGVTEKIVKLISYMCHLFS